VTTLRAVRARDVLRQLLREEVFRLHDPPTGPPHVGLEVEFLVLEKGTGAVPRLDVTLAALRRPGASGAWEEARSTRETPVFHLPGHGRLSFEPGGQVEVSTPALRSASDVVAWTGGILSDLEDALTRAGLELLGLGIDPCNPVERVPLQLDAPRYRRMASWLARRGTHGARMMRQSASVQVNMDYGESPLRAWRLMNAAAPSFTAIFANSPRYAGVATGHQSYRSFVWRELDPDRTGLFPCLDPVEEYLDFALEAPAILLGPEGAAAEPFRIWWNRLAATLDDWRAHLTTLFPDVRPRGYLEIRCLDALPREWIGVPPVLLAGLLYSPDAMAAAERLLGPPDPDLAWLAGEVGLRAPRLGAISQELFTIGLEGAKALPGMVTESDLATAHLFYETFTKDRRSPADLAEAPSLP